MRICAIGNSHLAAIKAGWDAIQHTRPKIKLTFFGAKSKLVQGLKVEGRTLVPSTEELRKALTFTSGGLDYIAADYDAYLIVGCEISLRTLVQAVQTGEKSGLETLDANAELSQTQAMQLVRQIHAISDAPVGIMPAPYHTGANAADAYAWGRGPHAMETLNKLYIDALKSLAQQHKFIFLQQPRKTFRGVEFLTAEEFGVNSERYDGRGQNNSGDGMHMNAEFGAIYLRSALKHLNVARPGQSADIC